MTKENGISAAPADIKHAVDYKPWLVLLGLWLLMLAAARPLGEFPLNDDWNYARSVYSLIHEHRLLITQWSLAASLTNIAVGWLFCLPLGFSFQALRLSSQLLAYLSAGGLFILLRRLGASPTACFIAALTLLGDPLLFHLANTFMTDATFGALVVAALLVMENDVQSQAGSRSPLLLSLVCVAVCLSRQTGLVVPIGCCLLQVYAARASRQPRRLINAVIPLIASIAAVELFQAYLAATTGPLMCYRVEIAYWQTMFAGGAAKLVGSFAGNLLRAVIYLGLMLLPFLAYWYPAFVSQLDSPKRRFALLVFAEVAILVPMALFATGNLMPLADNILFDGGLGPVLLPPYGHHTGWPAAPVLLWLAVTVLACLGVACMASMKAVVVLRLREKKSIFDNEASKRWTVLLASILASYLSLICLRGFFDRYLIFPLILCLPLIVVAYPVRTKPSAGWLAASAVLLLCFGCFSAAATHDYFAFSSARWQAAQKLLADGISPMDVEGGLEFNGWYAYDPACVSVGLVFSPTMTHNDRFAIALKPLSGYTQIGAVAFHRWLGGAPAAVLILRKANASGKK